MNASIEMKTFSNYKNLNNFWNDRKVNNRITTPQDLKMKLIIGVTNMQELYSKGEVKSIENLPSIDQIKSEDPYGIFQLSTKMSNEYFPIHRN